MAAGVAAVAAAQQAIRLFELGRLSGTCGVTSAPDCRRLDVPATVDALHRLDQRAVALLDAAWVLVAAGGIAWLLWQHAAQRLVGEDLRAPSARFTPGWAVGWWFVPLANLGKPAVAMAELWRASGGDDGTERRWQARPLPVTLRWWWGCWVVAVALGVLTRGQSDPAKATYFNLRGNAGALVLECAFVAAAGALAVRLVRSIDGRLAHARPYPDDVRAGGWATTPADEVRVGEAPDSIESTDPAAPASRGRALWVAPFAAVTAVVSAVVVVTSPSMALVGDPDLGTPSPVAEFHPPPGWGAFGGASDGFVLWAPPGWHETHDGSPALLRLEPAEGTDAVCLVVADARSAGEPLPGVVNELLSQIRDPSVYDLDGEVDVHAIVVPAGEAARLRFTASKPEGERGYVQFVLVDDHAGWLVGCDAPAADVDAMEPLFERMIATFRFTG